MLSMTFKKLKSGVQSSNKAEGMSKNFIGYDVGKENNLHS